MDPNEIFAKTKILENIMHLYPSGIGLCELEKEYAKWNPSDNNSEFRHVAANLANSECQIQSEFYASGEKIYYSSRTTADSQLPPGTAKLLERSDTGPFWPIYPIHFFDAHSFSAGFVDQDLQQYQDYLGQFNHVCSQKQLEPVSTLGVRIGDCCIICRTEAEWWCRCRVMAIDREKSTAECYAVDYGTTCKFPFSKMFVPPDDYITEEAGLMDFNVPGMTIRCTLDMRSKPAKFPMSKTALRYTLCGHSTPTTVKLKAIFRSYNRDYDSFCVNLYLLHGEDEEDLLKWSLETRPELAEMDRFFLKFDEDILTETVTSGELDEEEQFRRSIDRYKNSKETERDSPSAE